MVLIITVLTAAFLTFQKLAILPYIDRFGIVAGTETVTTELAFELWIEMPLLLSLILQERLNHFNAVHWVVYFLVNKQLGLFR